MIPGHGDQDIKSLFIFFRFTFSTISVCFSGDVRSSYWWYATHNNRLITIDLNTDYFVIASLQFGFDCSFFSTFFCLIPKFNRKCARIFFSCVFAQIVLTLHHSPSLKHLCASFVCPRASLLLQSFTAVLPPFCIYYCGEDIKSTFMLRIQKEFNSCWLSTVRRHWWT